MFSAPCSLQKGDVTSIVGPLSEGARWIGTELCNAYLCHMCREKIWDTKTSTETGCGKFTPSMTSACRKWMKVGQLWSTHVYIVGHLPKIPSCMRGNTSEIGKQHPLWKHSMALVGNIAGRLQQTVFGKLVWGVTCAEHLGGIYQLANGRCASWEGNGPIKNISAGTNLFAMVPGSFHNIFRKAFSKISTEYLVPIDSTCGRSQPGWTRIDLCGQV